MIKTTALIVLAAVMLAGAGVLSVRHYHQYKNIQMHQAQAAAQAKADELARVKANDAAEYRGLQTAYSKAVAECQKGQQAYASLTPLVRAKVPAPSCPAQVR